MAVGIKEEPLAAARAQTYAPSARAEAARVAAQTVPPIECAFEGRIGGFLSETSRLCLRISSDGEVHGEVWRKRPTAAATRAPASALGAAVAVNRVAKRRRVEAAEAANRQVDSTTHDQTTAAAGVWTSNDYVRIAHFVGSAVCKQTVQSGPSKNDSNECVVKYAAARDTSEARTPETFEYCCTFDVTKRAGHTDRHTVRCHMDFPAQATNPADKRAFSVAEGQWWLPYRRRSRIDEDATLSSSSSSSSSPSLSLTEEPKPEEKPFQLTRVDPNAGDVGPTALHRSRLYPLRPGKYDFRGFATYETPATAAAPRPRGRSHRSSATPAVVKDECIVSLRLLPDGTLRGTSRELVHPQVCTVRGTWQINRVVYILKYHVRDAVGHFRYSGGVDASMEGDKLVGKWRNVDDGHADGFQGGKGAFELALVHARYDTDADAKVKREKQQGEEAESDSEAPSGDQGVGTGAASDMDDNDRESIVTALTTGRYKLKGQATDSDGYEYAFELSMTLYPGGRLAGEVHERIFEQTRPVTGCWNRAGIAYQQAYVVRREVGMYLYEGVLSRDGVVLRGPWRNAEDKYAPSRSEHGSFALAVTSATRFWSTDSHRDFPRGFRAAARCLLLCSARSHALPGALWTSVLAFCDDKWFDPPDDCALVVERVGGGDGAQERKPKEVSA